MDSCTSYTSGLKDLELIVLICIPTSATGVLPRSTPWSLLPDEAMTQISTHPEKANNWARDALHQIGESSV